jgi:hypothetical protein
MAMKKDEAQKETKTSAQREADVSEMAKRLKLKTGIRAGDGTPPRPRSSYC